MKVSVKKSMRRPIFEEDSAEPWARVSDILLDDARTRVIAVVAATESIVPLRQSLPIDSISERDGLFWAQHLPPKKFVYCPPPVSCVNEIFRLKSAGGSRVLDICFEPEHGGIVGVTVGGLLNRKSINIIHRSDMEKEKEMNSR